MSFKAHYNARITLKVKYTKQKRPLKASSTIHIPPKKQIQIKKNQNLNFQQNPNSKYPNIQNPIP